MSEFGLHFEFGKVAGTIRRELEKAPDSCAWRDSITEIADAVADAYAHSMTGGVMEQRRVQFLETCGISQAPDEIEKLREDKHFR